MGQLRIECLVTLAQTVRMKVPNPKIVMHDKVLRLYHPKRTRDFSYDLPIPKFVFGVS